MKDNSDISGSEPGLEGAIRQLARAVETLTATLQQAQPPAAATPAAKPGPAPKAAPKAAPAPKAKAVAKADADTVRLALIGTRGHGKILLKAFTGQKRCRFTHVCDADTRPGKATVTEIANKQGHRPEFEQDYRKLLANPDIDAVVLATPHHWHALMAVEALRAGKHVYLEKPVTHNMNEGPVLRAAAAKYGRVLQAGTQLRSNTSLAAAGEYMRAGKLGKILGVHCLIHKDRPPMPPSTETTIPASVDFDLWCGPGPMDAPARGKFHYHWHWFWDYGNGALGNNGVHRIDVARIALDLKGLGDLAISLGGRFGPRDNGETPNNQLTLHRFGDIWVLQDVLGLKPKAFRGIENGIFFYGTQGTILYNAGKATLLDADQQPVSTFPGKQESHHANFLDAIVQKNPDLARGDLDEAILSSDLCHLGNISYRLGDMAADEDIARRLQMLDVPQFVLDRLQAQRENLTQNGLDDQMILGRLLQPGTGSGADALAHDPEARALATNSYRAPYLLPAPSEV